MVNFIFLLKINKGSFLAPYIVSLSKMFGLNPLLILVFYNKCLSYIFKGLIGILALIAMFFLKETHGKPILDEIIELSENKTNFDWLFAINKKKIKNIFCFYFFINLKNDFFIFNLLLYVLHL